MQLNLDSVHSISQALEGWKFWALLGSGVIGAYKWYTWVKEIRTVDLDEVRTGIKTMSVKFDDGFDKLVKKVEETSANQVRSTEFQTSSFVRELQEMRQDFRTFYTNPTPAMLPAHARPRAPRKPRTPKGTAKIKLTGTMVSNDPIQ